MTNDRWTLVIGRWSLDIGQWTFANVSLAAGAGAGGGTAGDGMGFLGSFGPELEHPANSSSKTTANHFIV